MSKTNKHYSEDFKRDVLVDLAESGLTQVEIARKYEIPSNTLSTWVSKSRLENSHGNNNGRVGIRRSDEFKRQVVEDFQKSDLPKSHFAKSKGISHTSLNKWLELYSNDSSSSSDPSGKSSINPGIRASKRIIDDLVAENSQLRTERDMYKDMALEYYARLESSN